MSGRGAKTLFVILASLLPATELFPQIAAQPGFGAGEETLGNPVSHPEATDSFRPEDFAALQNIIPGIEIELRYFGSNNFVGRPIAGYETNVAYLTQEAATALSSAQRELATERLGFKVFDAYRPQRAVDDFMAWAADPEDTATKSTYYPALDKSTLTPDGYIAERSGHSRGSTIDLTLIDLDSREELDMGSPYDFFDPVSWPASTSIAEIARQNRMKLSEIMWRHGFEPLSLQRRDRGRWPRLPVMLRIETVNKNR